MPQRTLTHPPTQTLTLHTTHPPTCMFFTMLRRASEVASALSPRGTSSHPLPSTTTSRSEVGR